RGSPSEGRQAEKAWDRTVPVDRLTGFLEFGLVDRFLARFAPARRLARLFDDLAARLVRLTLAARFVGLAIAALAPGLFGRTLLGLRPARAEIVDRDLHARQLLDVGDRFGILGCDQRERAALGPG